jgi:hypothetical protein
MTTKMAKLRETDEVSLTRVDIDGSPVTVSVRITFDGIEYLGRLWFTQEGWTGSALPDRGPVAGKTRDHVVAAASQLTPDDLRQRFRRALAEKRRFLGLRRVTDDILSKIRYLNQVAIAMRAGLLDAEGAAQEIDLTEKQLHDLVGDLREHAGLED